LKVRWTRRARLHLAGIEEFIGSRNAKAAQGIGVAIRSAVSCCKTSLTPSGLDAAGTRDVRGLPYIIVYEVSPDRNELFVLGAFHGAQKRPDDLAR